ncbi:helical backbone metal receptor [uncultured Paludibaculum sp.]|uniref:ABC transporter substrate-binding protein n=1 Tax=uncultured Paludibaculum sp. TaxID=1765020 RepID=UPI002AAC3634|nr:helical backbone metal receptor [uncultured Paludibaculum sp.]
MTRRGLAAGILILGLAAHLAAAPRRIISIAPSVTEILYGLGVFERVVAVSEYCTYPPAVKSLPRVGGWHTPNLEKLVALQPDLVVMTEAQAPFIHEQLQQLGIRTLVTPSQTVEDALNAIEAIGRATGKEREASALVAATRLTLDGVRARARNLPHPAVLCVVDRTPGTLRDLYAATRGSFLTELIETAGGRVVVAQARAGYGKISKETILTLNPETVIELMPGSKGRYAGDPLAAWRDLPELKAVQLGKVYQVKEDFVPHASQLIARTVVLFARLVHPEVPALEWETK